MQSGEYHHTSTTLLQFKLPGEFALCHLKLRDVGHNVSFASAILTDNSQNRWKIIVHVHEGNFGNNHFSVTLKNESVSSDNEITVNGKFFLKNSAGEEFVSHKFIKSFPSHVKYTAENFCDRHIVKQFGLIHNGWLTIYCELNVEKNVIAKNSTTNKPVYMWNEIERAAGSSDQNRDTEWEDSFSNIDNYISPPPSSPESNKSPNSEHSTTNAEGDEEHSLDRNLSTLSVESMTNNDDEEIVAENHRLKKENRLLKKSLEIREQIIKEQHIGINKLANANLKTQGILNEQITMMAANAVGAPDRAFPAVGYRDDTNDKVHLGQGIWIANNNFEKLKIAKKVSIFVRGLTSLLFTEEELASSTLTGLASNRSKKPNVENAEIAKPKQLNPTKVLAIEEITDYFLQLQKFSQWTQIRKSQELDNVRAYISAKAAEYKRKHKT